MTLGPFLPLRFSSFSVTIYWRILSVVETSSDMVSNWIYWHEVITYCSVGHWNQGMKPNFWSHWWQQITCKFACFKFVQYKTFMTFDTDHSQKSLVLLKCAQANLYTSREQCLFIKVYRFACAHFISATGICCTNMLLASSSTVVNQI